MTEAEAVIGGLILFGVTGLFWWLIVGIVRDPKERAEALRQFSEGMRLRPLKTLISLAFVSATVAFFTGIALDILGIFDPPTGFYLYVPLAMFILLIGAAFF